MLDMWFELHGSIFTLVITFFSIIYYLCLVKLKICTRFLPSIIYYQLLPSFLLVLLGANLKDVLSKSFLDGRLVQLQHYSVPTSSPGGLMFFMTLFQRVCCICNQLLQHLYPSCFSMLQLHR